MRGLLHDDFSKGLAWACTDVVSTKGYENEFKWKIIVVNLMKNFFKIILIVGITSCDKVPRGAPMTAEVLRPHDSMINQFNLHKVDSDFFPVNEASENRRENNETSWSLTKSEHTHIQIKTGDRITLEVWDGADNSLITPVGQKRTLMQDIVVSEAGIFVPYVGTVNVNSLSQDQARDKIQDTLAQIVPSAQVSLNLTPGAENSVNLVGGFKNSGTIPLQADNSSILSMIASAGGVDPNIKFPIITVIRNGRHHTTSLEDLYSDPEKDINLQGGDKLLVREDERYFLALGATGKETLIPFNQESISALDAISKFGGISDKTGNLRGILIFRAENLSAQDRGNGVETGTRDIYALDLTSADGIFSAKKFLIQHQDLVLVTDTEITAVGTALKFLASITGVR